MRHLFQLYRAVHIFFLHFHLDVNLLHNDILQSKTIWTTSWGWLHCSAEGSKGKGGVIIPNVVFKVA